MLAIGRVIAVALLLALLAPLRADNPPGSPPSPPTTITTPPGTKTTEAAPPLVTEIEGKNVTQWMADLKHDDPSVREEAIRALTFFGPAASEAVPILVDRCHDKDLSPRVKAVIALTIIPINEKDLPKVVEALGKRVTDDSQAIVRFQAAVALVHMGKDAKGALPQLLQGVEDVYSWEIRRACVAALAEAAESPKGPDPKVIRALLTALKDPAAQVRVEAAMVLAELGGPPDATTLAMEIKALEAQFTDRDKTVAIWAHLTHMSLEKVNDGSMKFLTKCLKPPEPLKVRLHAAKALGSMGPNGKPAVPDLIDMLSDKDPSAVSGACWSLGQIGDSAAVAPLTELTKNKEGDPGVKQAAADALDAIKKDKPKDKDMK